MVGSKMGIKSGLFERLLPIPVYDAQYWGIGLHVRIVRGHHSQDCLEPDHLGKERASLVLRASSLVAFG